MGLFLDSPVRAEAKTALLDGRSSRSVLRGIIGVSRHNQTAAQVAAHRRRISSPTRQSFRTAFCFCCCRLLRILWHLGWEIRRIAWADWVHLDTLEKKVEYLRYGARRHDGRFFSLPCSFPVLSVEANACDEYVITAITFP